MSSDSVCYYTCDETNQTPIMGLSDFVNSLYDYKLNWTPISPDLLSLLTTLRLLIGKEVEFFSNKFF